MGIGHFMRCLNLATGLKQQHDDIRFVCRNLPGTLKNVLNNNNITFDLLDTEEFASKPVTDLDYTHWLPCSQEDDAESMADLMSGKSVDWLVVDHYALDHLWESRLRKKATKILVIDDLANRQHDCDVLLDQNYYCNMKSRYTGHVKASTQMLLGPDYALLHQAFSLLRGSLKKRTGSVEKLLVFFGGGDANNCTELVLDAIESIESAGLSITVAVGGQHPALDSISARCIGKGFELAIQSDEIARLMAEADISIGAGGVATWERCCMGLPAIVIAIAENQESISEAVASLGAAKYLGKQADISKDHIHQSLISLIYNKEVLTDMSEKAMSLVDGWGVQRVCTVMSR